MSKVKVTLPDNSVKEFEKGVTPYDVALSIGKGLAKSAVAAELNGNAVDLTKPINEDTNIKIYTKNSHEGLHVLRHSTAHLMAQAVQHLFPKTKYAIGPSIKDGFYYDFDSPHRFTPDDLEKIQGEMQKIVEQDLPVERMEMKRGEAIEYFKKREDPFKVEILTEQITDDVVSMYKQGDFVDLCTGPHVPSTSYITAFKLQSIAGAYWRGDENNAMLQRIYGTCFATEKELKKHLRKLEEAKKRDHRKIGKELGLFSFHEQGPGFPFWHSKGTAIYNALSEYIRKQNTLRGYEEIMTPIILNEELWHRSGHWDNFKDNMYFTEIDERTFAVKPMNCPGGLLIYKTGLHSYRDLPLKVAELGTVHRHELSGVLHGLFRVRCFTQDDAHIFCTEEQLVEQIRETFEYVMEVYKDFGFNEYEIFIATKPDKAIGSDEVWDFSTHALKTALKNLDVNYKIKEGEGAFYGPKIELNIQDSLERMWQCGTIQVDLSMPERFDLTYEGSDGQRHRPIMIHRAVFGSLERFIGILIEHYEGKFPLWFAPVQVKILPISDAQNEYAKNLYEQLVYAGIRVEIDLRNESLGYKIRSTQKEKVPYMLICGEKEQEHGTVSVRNLKGKQKHGVLIPELLELLNKEIEMRTLLEDSLIYD